MIILRRMQMSSHVKKTIYIYYYKVPYNLRLLFNCCINAALTLTKAVVYGKPSNKAKLGGIFVGSSHATKCEMLTENVVVATKCNLLIFDLHIFCLQQTCVYTKIHFLVKNQSFLIFTKYYLYCCTAINWVNSIKETWFITNVCCQR